MAKFVSQDEVNQRIQLIFNELNRKIEQRSLTTHVKSMLLDLSSKFDQKIMKIDKSMHDLNV